jgi:hypothetical protein
MDARPVIRRVPSWIVAGVSAGLIVLIAVAVLWFAVPTIQRIFAPVSDDRCEHSLSGEPDRDDPDCYSGGLGGVNEVEAWDRAHPAP